MQKFLYFLVLIFCFGCSNAKKEYNQKEEVLSQEDLRPKSTINMSDYKFITSVRKNNQWYFINENNEVLFDKVFTFASYFSDGLSCVSMDGIRVDGEDKVFGAYYTAMDKEGNFIEAIKSDLPFVFKEGRSIISYGPDKMLIDKEGRVIKTDLLKAYGEFNEGKIPVFKNGKIEYWNKEGEIVLGPAEYTTQGFSEDRALVLLNGKYGFIDEQGNQVVDYIYGGGSNYSEGFAWVKEKDVFYFINKSGEKKIGPFQKVRSFKEGKAAVFSGGAWKYIDTSGKDVFDKSFSEVDDFSEGYAIVKLNNGKLAMLSAAGEEELLDARVAFQFRNGIAIAEKDAKMGYITNEGKWMIEPQYENIHDFFMR